MDVIIHVIKLDRFRIEAAQHANDKTSPIHNLFKLDVDGNLAFNASKVPVVYYGNESLCLIRAKDDRALDYLTYMKRLGECINGVYVFDSDACRDTYERIYDVEPIMVDDGDGVMVEYVPPYNIGTFS